MKKFISLIFIALLCSVNMQAQKQIRQHFRESAGTSVSQALKDLKDGINEANEEFPIDLGDGLTMQKITIDDNYVVYKYTLDPNFASVDNIRAAKAEVCSATLEELRQSYQTDTDVKCMVDLMIKTKKNFKYIFKDEQSGEAVTFVIKSTDVTRKD